MTDIVVEPSIFTRDFTAPIELVYKVWTQEEHLCQWQVPNAKVRCEYHAADIRTGGSSLHKMTMPNGNEMWLLTQYQLLSPHHTIVFTQYASNEAGDIMPPPIPHWPKELQVTIKLSEQSEGTHMTFTWQPINLSQEEADAWEASRPQHSNGWGGSFDQLLAYLENLRMNTD